MRIFLKSLEQYGYLKELKRVKVGQFSIEQAVSLKEIENMQYLKEIERTEKSLEIKNKVKEIAQEIHVISIEEFFKDTSKIILEDYKLTLFLNGVKLSRIEKDRNICYLSKTRQIYRNGNHTKRNIKKGYCGKMI